MVVALLALAGCDGTLGSAHGGSSGNGGSSGGTSTGATSAGGHSGGEGGHTAGAGGGVGGTGGIGGSMISVHSATNPVLGPDHPDPDVLRTIAADGKALYYMTVTGGNSGDLPLFTSRDLLTWTPAANGLFQTGFAGAPVHLNGAWFCNLWAPAMREVKPGVVLLGFSAQRFASNPGACPPYADDGGVYLASSDSPLGPFATGAHPWEPFPSGANEGACPKAVRDSIPHSVNYVSGDCQGGYCDNVVRLDADFFFDPATGRDFMAYAWYTNTPPKVPWESANYGEHVSITELDPADPFAVRCDAQVTKVFAGNPHDAVTLDRLAQSCPDCGQMLSMTKGRFDEELSHEGVGGWGVVEGPSLFRRGEYVYLLMSGSAWDSAYYHVFWVAAKSVEELAYDNPGRLVGRYLIPSDGQSFGHGTAVLGPDGEHFYFVHHRLDHGPCKGSGACQRDVWVSPIEFEDRGDGLGAVYIRARRPAQTPGVEVAVP